MTKSKIREEGGRVSGILYDAKLGRDAYMAYAGRNQINNVRFYGNIG